jgi:hypothetical protein
MLLTSKPLKHIYPILGVHKLKPAYKVHLPILPLFLSELFRVEVSDVIESELLHVDPLIRLLDLHHSLRRLIRDYNDHALKYGVILIEGELGAGCTAFGDHLGRDLFLDLLEGRLRSHASCCAHGGDTFTADH